MIVRLNVFAGALVAAAKDAGKMQTNSKWMPDFEREFAGQAAEFDTDRIPELVASLPENINWDDIQAIIQEVIRGCILLHPEDGIGPTVTLSGRIHCPLGCEPSDVYFCC